MSNIHQSILEKLTALNIDIFHYEDIVRCYALAKLNIQTTKRIIITPFQSPCPRPRRCPEAILMF